MLVLRNQRGILRGHQHRHMGLHGRIQRIPRMGGFPKSWGERLRFGRDHHCYRRGSRQLSHHLRSGQSHHRSFLLRHHFQRSLNQDWRHQRDPQGIGEGLRGLPWTGQLHTVRDQLSMLDLLHLHGILATRQCHLLRHMGRLQRWKRMERTRSMGLSILPLTSVHLGHLQLWFRHHSGQGHLRLIRIR